MKHSLVSMLGPYHNEYVEILNANFFSPVLLANHLISNSNTRKVINILSTTAICGRKNHSAYSSSKSALWAYSRSLRRNKGNRIQVLEVIPSTFKSDLNRNSQKKGNEATVKSKNDYLEFLGIQHDFYGKTDEELLNSSNENSKFVSDNIVLYDEDKVYPCFEPIRLDDNSISLMPDKGRKLVSMNIDSCYGRASYCVNENDTIQEMIPEILIIPCRADTGSLVEISYQDAAQLCMDFNRIAGETNSFLTYSSVQNMHFQKSGLDTSMLSTLHTLTKKLKCYMLTMKENTSIDKVLRMINEEIIDCS